MNRTSERINGMKAVPAVMQDMGNAVFHRVEDIADWPDARFKADGHHFQLFIDGESILYRMLAKDADSLLPAERERISGIAGVILETGNPGAEPMVFETERELFQNWVDLHALYNVPLTDDEAIRMAEIEPSFGAGQSPLVN